MTTAAIHPDLAIATVHQYFSTLNQGAFAQTAALFAQDGVLYPPFEEGVQGPEAIAAYLSQEAQGIQIEPLEIDPIPDCPYAFQVKGRVKLSWCQVKAAWKFVLSPDSAIASVQIKLLASLQDLLQFRQ
ncbi:ketosteroid isomerase family protein [Lyngbya confervoides]|uniref:Ketosteroid isomerase family protein n=1 Tax=Lyngbya confervoides BDU141951 TaxID=1574623 RepID=A0ABD4T6D9_9CYAN|nr:ketosteroid isomerase family protein [Lyngbya confervoides]MCM1984336.1 ketosteroid isomerase family protein [Lyngbya confervoides BDU141951]